MSRNDAGTMTAELKPLKSLCCDIIRDCWEVYQTVIPPTSPAYDMLWNGWFEKCTIAPDNIYASMLKYFLDGRGIVFNHDRIKQFVDNGALIIRFAYQDEIRTICDMCDKMGLHYENLQDAARDKSTHRLLRIFKPVTYKWEFTERCQESFDRISHYESRQRANQEKREIKEKKRNKFLARHSCDECGKNGLEVSLARSPYVDGTYCSHCLSVVIGDDGETLDCHKWEGIDEGF